jgi:hypothetical protein
MCCLLVKELADKGLRTNIKQLIKEMTEVKRILTFFGDIKKPEKVLTYTCGSDFAEQVLSLYKLREKYF